MNSEKKLARIGLIGAGNVTETYHLGPLKTLPNVKIEWVVDTSKVRAEYIAGLANATAYTMLAECSDVDIALVAIPVGARRSVVEQVISRSWHAFCEKPFALSLADHRAMVDAARNRGVRLGVGLVRRQYSSTRAAQSILTSGVLGKIEMILGGEGMVMHRTGRGGEWYQGSAEASGGTLMETGSHLVDQAFTICGVSGFEIERCTQQHCEGLEFETSARGRVEVQGGAVVPFAFVISRLRDVYNGIVVRCTNGELRVGLSPDQKPEIFVREGQRAASVELQQPLVTNISSAVRAEWTEFMNECAQSSEFSDFDTGLLTTAFLEACYRESSRAPESEPAGVHS
jgi:predicted dehydrogenase